MIQTTPFYNGGLREQDEDENVKCIRLFGPQFRKVKISFANGKGNAISVRYTPLPHDTRPVLNSNQLLGFISN